MPKKKKRLSKAVARGRAAKPSRGRAAKRGTSVSLGGGGGGGGRRP